MQCLLEIRENHLQFCLIIVYYILGHYFIVKIIEIANTKCNSDTEKFKIR